MPEAVDAAAVGVAAGDAAAPVDAAPFVATNADFLFALAALREITPNDSIGPPVGSITEDDGSVTVYFDNNLSGYPGWRWTVSIAHVDSETSTILETELTPGDDALLSPAWVPWVERLADYRIAQDELGDDSDELDDADSTDDDGDDSDDDDDTDDDDSDDDGLDDDDDTDDDDDDSDDDDDDFDVLHSGDVDGVDIDEDDDDSDDSDDDDDGLAAAQSGVDEPDDAEDDADNAHPGEPGFAGRYDRADSEEEHDKSY